MSQANSRMTKQRATILNELCSLRTHPTADEIYKLVQKKIPNISLGTIYRNLEYLAENNSILKIENAGAQKRFDGNITPHQHIRCEHCGKVSDVMPEIPTVAIDESIRKQIGQQKFHLTGIRLELSGVCFECAQKQ